MGDMEHMRFCATAALLPVNQIHEGSVPKLSKKGLEHESSDRPAVALDEAAKPKSRGGNKRKSAGMAAGHTPSKKTKSKQLSV